MRIGIDVLRSLEHHVFEQMRESRSPGPLILGADVIPDGDVRNRRRVILRQDHAQPVRQREQLVC